MQQRNQLSDFDRDGIVVLDHSETVLRWAKVAAQKAEQIACDPDMRRQWLRHGDTWFVGVDALPNAPDGSVDGVPLTGAWEGIVDAPSIWHPAQLSIVYPGYPLQDADESDAAHRFRLNRNAAHVDGLLPEGPDRRRYLREPHAFILGLPLDECQASPLVVWPGSHHVMRAALAEACHGHDISKFDLTDVYQATRRHVFETIEPVDVRAVPGQAMLLHRHMLHGVRPWNGPGQERKVAYFRPQFSDVFRWLDTKG
ncbi:hypothetical protein [Shimia ponticola]|uniref:hypothetical protein n=1 Tax=Shimia ponticola TaxID=2582893 RepID=UPI0021037808|nr:hypothetical protein [Shimia ponticola]